MSRGKPTLFFTMNARKVGLSFPIRRNGMAGGFFTMSEGKAALSFGMKTGLEGLFFTWMNREGIVPLPDLGQAGCCG